MLDKLSIGYLLAHVKRRKEAEGLTKNRGKQIRRCNLRVYTELDKTDLTLQDLAQKLGIRRETLSKKLQRVIPDQEQDRIITEIRRAAGTSSRAGAETGTNTNTE